MPLVTEQLDFAVGDTLLIDGDCPAVIDQVSDQQIHIRSECFTGWAEKSETE